MYWNKLNVKMRTMRRKEIIKIIVILLLTLPQLVSGQFTETRQISKRFKITPETRIELTNKYGKIEFNAWEKDSVVINIEISVEDKKLSKLEKSLDNIDFETISNPNFLIVRTVVGDNMGSIEKELQKLMETVFQASGNMEINYSVWLPITNELKVENKFGDIYIGDYSGDIEIDLSNGNLKSHDFDGKTKITLNFGDATINNIKNGTFECNYGEVYLKDADKLHISSKSSEFEINNISDLSTESRRDKFRIKKADLVDAKGSFSNFRLSELTDRAILRVEYGDIEIEKIANDFSSVYIESNSTDIDLYFNNNSKFNFEITNTKSETRFGQKINIDSEETLDEKEKKVKLTGSYGEKAENAKLYINAVGGEIGIHSDN